MLDEKLLNEKFVGRKKMLSTFSNILGEKLLATFF
jgi:hypothetical protein